MSELHALGDEIFDRYNAYPGDGERNHCLRLVEFARLHARLSGIDVDEGLLHLNAMLHDLGLMVKFERGTTYLTRTLVLARKELEEVELDDEVWTVIEECLLYNHAVRLSAPLQPLAESFRRAVFTEHTRGVQRFGLPNKEVRAVFRAVPFDNFATVLADFFWKTLVFEPGTVPHIFFPQR